MLNSLQYEATFTTGLTLQNQFDFSEGMTLIGGANETGKSFILEMIRFALFGNKALRGTADDYVKINCTLVCRIRGEQVTITRSKTKASLTQNSQTMMGKSIVDRALVGLLGFDFNVFECACSITQGEVERLGAMRPTERRAVVDSVVGLDRLEDVEGQVRTVMRDYKTRAGEAPDKPVEPEIGTHRSPDTINDDLGELVADLKELRRLERIEFPKEWLAEPKRPHDLSIDTLHERQDALREFNRVKKARDKIEGLPPQIDESDLSAHEEWAAHEDRLSRAPEPEISERDAHDTVRAWEAFSKRRSWEKGTIDCPECGSKVSVTEQDEPPECEQPEIGEAEARKAIRGWENHKSIVVPTVARPDGKLLTSNGVASQRRNARLRASLEDLPEKPADPTDQIAQLRAYEKASTEFERQQGLREQYDRFQELEKLNLGSRTKSLREEWEAAVKADRIKRDYETAVAQYERAIEEHNTNLAEGDAWSVGVDAVRELRSRIKRQLVPSLNRVSSALISRMTDGERSQIEVDEAFNITVDGQRLSTLSGSGKAVANLAIRIGLGQVLTNGVFSVLMADEIDGSMDADRAQSTMKTLENLIGPIAQIIVVSHKEHPELKVIRFTS